MGAVSRGWFTYTFRGEERVVVIDAYDVDHSVNAVECEWHFEDVTPEQHDALAVTDVEEQAIIDAIDRHIQDADAAADEYERQVMGRWVDAD